MERLPVLIGAVCFFAVTAYSIGLQHAVFRSQSTQGKAWAGSVTFVREVIC
jgi:hypothetical protein